MKKFLYCDSCFLITFFQDNCLEALSRYKDTFYISETQVSGELVKPDELAKVVRKTINIIKEDREEIIAKTNELASLYESLSKYDCLCLAYACIDGYCLITDDKTLQKKCLLNGIEVFTSGEIKKQFLDGGDEDETVKK